MSAIHYRWCRHLIAGAAIALSAAGTSCASPRAGQPHVPDQSALKPATQALEKAVSAHANQFAPRIVDSARRHITVARDILFKAAEDDRSPTPAENARLQKLVDQARLDARAALIKTQAATVQRQIKKLQSSSGSSNGASGASNSQGTSGTETSGLGISSFAPGTGLGNPKRGVSQ